MFLIIHHKPLVSTILGLLINLEDNQVMALAQGSSASIEDNITDEEKELRMSSASSSSSAPVAEQSAPVSMTPHLEIILDSLCPSENDYEALFALSLLYAIGENKGVAGDDGSSFWDTVEWKPLVISKLMLLLTSACQMTSKIRPVTVDLAIALLLKMAIVPGNQHRLDDKSLALLEQAKEESIMVSRTFFKSEDMFLELFEAEANEIIKRPLQVEYLLQDSSILLPPTGTPMTGIEFTKRLPCGEVERARRAIRVFVLMRRLSLAVSGEVETQLPLVRAQQCIKVSDVLDLSIYLASFYLAHFINHDGLVDSNCCSIRQITRTSSRAPWSRERARGRDDSSLSILSSSSWSSRTLDASDGEWRNLSASCRFILLHHLIGLDSLMRVDYRALLNQYRFFRVGRGSDWRQGRFPLPPRDGAQFADVLHFSHG